MCGRFKSHLGAHARGNWGRQDIAQKGFPLHRSWADDPYGDLGYALEAISTEHGNEVDERGRRTKPEVCKDGPPKVMGPESASQS